MPLDVTLYHIDEDESGQAKKPKMVGGKPSMSHPDHEYRIGRFSSKYGPDGFNTVMERLVGANLLTIFGFTSTPPGITPIDWNAAKQRIVDLRLRLKSYLEDTGGFHRVASFVHRNVDSVDSYEKALKLFRQEMSRYRKDPDPEMGNYSSESGEFMFATPWKVRAIIPGVIHKSPCSYVVYEEELKWYEEAIDVIEETIDNVLSVPEEFGRHSYQIGWSG